MATMIMPRLGETVTEGTVIRWLKREGDTVNRDEMIVEISTDKVDSELPSPISGILTKILVHEEETVPVDTDLAVIEEVGAAKTPPGTHKEFNKAHAPISLLRLAHEVITVGDGFRDLVIQVLHAVMEQVAAQPADCALHAHPVVRVNPADLAALSPPKADLPIRIPITVPNPPPAIQCASRKTVASVTGSLRITGEEAQNLRAQGIGDDFVRVQTQQPGLDSLCDGRFLLLGKTFPGFPKNLRAKFGREPVRAIGDILVQHDDNLRGPAMDALQRAADAVGLSPGDHVHRNGQRAHWTRDGTVSRIRAFSPARLVFTATAIKCSGAPFFSH